MMASQKEFLDIITIHFTMNLKKSIPQVFVASKDLMIYSHGLGALNTTELLRHFGFEMRQNYTL